MLKKTFTLIFVYLFLISCSETYDSDIENIEDYTIENRRGKDIKNIRGKRYGSKKNRNELSFNEREDLGKQINKYIKDGYKSISIPKGTYKISTKIKLESNIKLYFDDYAVIKRESKTFLILHKNKISELFFM